MNTSQTYPIRNKNVFAREEQLETVIVIPDRGKAEVVNELGGFIWSKITGGLSVDDIVQVICEEYPVDEEEARADAVLFLKSLELKGAIWFASEPPR